MMADCMAMAIKYEQYWHIVMNKTISVSPINNLHPITHNSSNHWAHLLTLSHTRV